jgi:hypothetical protein
MFWFFRNKPKYNNNNNMYLLVSEYIRRSLYGVEEWKINFKYIAVQWIFTSQNGSHWQWSEVYIFLFGFLSHVVSLFWNYGWKRKKNKREEKAT